jgi:hypothetical protein
MKGLAGERQKRTSEPEPEVVVPVKLVTAGAAGGQHLSDTN